jgi:hypothetical protein
LIVTAAPLAIAGLSAALLFAAAAESGEARPPGPGFWEFAPLTPRGEAASIVVRRSGGRTVVTAISAPAPPCRDLFGILGEPGSPLPSLPVDRRGRFAGARRVRTDGIAAVSGRFLGARPRRALLHARWHAGPCRAGWEFRLRPVRRVAIPDGKYTGTHTSGGAISFEVVNTGREAYLFRLTPSPLFRCSDGSSYRISDYSRGTPLAWIGRGGDFALRDAEDDWLFTMRGALDRNGGSGTFRVIETHPDARGACDPGVVGFTANPSA